MKSLKELMDEFRDSTVHEALNFVIPNELKMPGKPLYGMCDAVIRSVLCISSNTKTYPELAEDELILLVKLQVAETVTNVHDIFARQLACREVFRISDNEFNILKEAYLNLDQIYENKAKLETAANQSKTRVLVNLKALKNNEFGFDIDDLLKSPLYIFISDLLIASTSALNRIELNEHVLGDKPFVEKTLQYLKDFTSEEDFDHSITPTQFVIGVRAICSELKLRPSIVPQSIVYLSEDECKDINEETLELFFINKLNRLFSNRNLPLLSSNTSTSFLDKNLASTCNISSNIKDATIQNINIQALTVLNRFLATKTQK